MKKFSDIVRPEDRGKLRGIKAKIDDFLNFPVEVLDADIFDSVVQPGTKCMSMQVRKAKMITDADGTSKYEDDKIYLIHTSSSVLMSRIEKYREQLPFEAIIIKDRNSQSGRMFYDFDAGQARGEEADDMGEEFDSVPDVAYEATAGMR